MHSYWIHRSPVRDTPLHLRRNQSALDEIASSPTRDIQSSVLNCNRDDPLVSVSTARRDELLRPMATGSLFVDTRLALALSSLLDKSAADMSRLLELDMALLIKSSGRSPTSAAIALRRAIFQTTYAVRVEVQVTHSAAT